MPGVVTLAAGGSRYYPAAPVEEYGGYTVTIYSAPTDQGSGDGSSEANAMAFETALSTATAGDVIGLVNDVYLNVASPAYRSNVPGWHPANSGTSGSPIVIVGKYDPTLMATPLSDGTRTELQAGSGSYGGSDSHPVFGANNRDYIRWINIVCNETNCVTKADNGPCYIADSTGCYIDHCVIYGSTDAYFSADNHSAIRIGEGGTTDTGHVITNNIMYNFTVGLSTNAAAVITYGAQNTTIDNNLIYDCTTGIYIKGTGASNGTWNYGSTSSNIIRSVSQGMRLEAIDPSNDQVVNNNLIYDFTGAGLVYGISAGAGNTRNIIVTRNSIVVTGAAANEALYVKALTGTGNEVINNIVSIYGTTNQAYIDGGEYTDNNFTAITYNGFYGSTATNLFSWNGANQTSVAAFESAATNAANNQTLAGDPFVDQSTDDYTVTGAALTASSTGGPIGADFSTVGPQ